MKRSPDEERYSAIDENLKRVVENVARAAEKSGRAAKDVELMAVTKNVDSRFINRAVADGIRLIGENRVQEFLSKEPEMNLSECKAHLIGHLQSNKVKKIVGKVEVIQSVDSVSIAEEIGRRSLEAGINSKILLEVNVGNEESKFGFAPDEVFEKAREIAEIKGVSIEGLMCVEPICEKESEVRAVFARMRRLFIDIRDKKNDNIRMNVLSMGMSGDYEQAVLEGSNLVRIGSAIFGARIYG